MGEESSKRTTFFLGQKRKVLHFSSLLPPIAHTEKRTDVELFVIFGPYVF